MKTRLQIKLDNMDPFEAIKKLMIAGKVYRANVVDFESIVIYYDSRKINESELKAIIGVNKSNGEKLKSIISAVKES
jgi:phosphomannomutase